MNYKVADIIFSMKPDKRTELQAEKYIYNGPESPEFYFEPISYEDYLKSKRDVDYEAISYLSCGQRFYLRLINYGGFHIHSSAVVVDDRAYLFSASCGTGKSTHTGKWLELFGERAYILNDDKPAIRIKEDGIFAYGTPWSGKHDISVNKGVKLGGICFLDRDTENWIKPMDKSEAFIRMYHGATTSLSKNLIEKLIENINIVSAEVPIYKMGCTPTVEAAKMAYEAMSKF